MVKSKRTMGTAMSMPGGIVLGVGISIVITLIGALILTALISHQSMRFESVGYGCTAALLVSSLAGSYLSAQVIKRRSLLVCGLTGLIYFLILLSVTAMFFGGVYSGVGMSALMVFLGSGGAAFLSTALKKQPNWNKRKIAFR